MSAENKNSSATTALDGIESCGLHRRTPYGIKNVSATQFSIARHYGGIKFNGEKYTYLPHTHELIRDDVLKWQRKQKRAAANVKCKHCNRLRSEHQAKTSACPMGSKHRTVGWTSYSPTQTYSPND